MEVCGSSLLWRLLPVGGVGLVVCQSSLVKEAFICVLVSGAGSLPMECNEVSSSEFWHVYGFGMVWGSLYFNAQGCVPAFLEN